MVSQKLGATLEYSKLVFSITPSFGARLRCSERQATLFSYALSKWSLLLEEIV